MNDGSPTAATHTRGVSARIDRGSTFIEVMVSVVLLGTVGVAVLTALAAATRGAAVHRDIADAQLWLANAGDALTDDDSDYVDCVTQPDPAMIANQYEATIIAPITAAASAPTIDIINVEFWDSVGSTYDPVVCNYGPPQGDRLQRITLQTTIDGETRTLVVVKRPALPVTVNTGVVPTTIGGGSVVPPLTPGI